ncbi:MAG: 2-phospho-L-lactate guanylyltransferase [Chloroflexota bacterium]
MTIWAIIPVKPPRDSKSRLAHILSAAERAELTIHLFSNTLQVLKRSQTIARTLVISRDPAVLKLARQANALTYGEGDRPQELNLAITRAAHIAAAQQATGVLVLPADLPFITVEDVQMMTAAALPAAGQPSGNGYYHKGRCMAICTDHNEDGTNALLVCPPTGFTFQYGPGSYQRHLDEARRLGMPYRVIHALGLKFDVDTEADWETYKAMTGVR